MTFISYAQNYEDVMLWRALKHIEKGFYVDVGAFDPTFDSVTQAFYERGWQGINIEPVLSYYERLRSARPRDINLHVAVANEESELIFYKIPETGLSTLNKEIAEDQRMAGWPVIEQKVSVLTLNQIFDEHVNGPIHFLKIDVEGAEKQVLQGLDLSRWRPWILVLEAAKPSSSELNFGDWETLVLSAEYKMVYFDGLNRFYVANEFSTIAKLLKTPPNVFDGFITNRQKDALDERDKIQTELKDALDERDKIQTELKDALDERDKIQTELDVKADRNTSIEAALTLIHNSRGWHLLTILYRISAKLIPRGSFRRKVAGFVCKCIKPFAKSGWKILKAIIAFLRRIKRYLANL